MFSKEHHLPVLSLNSAGLGGGVLDTLGDRSSGKEEKNNYNCCFRFIDKLIQSLVPETKY